jgi:citrate lyase beta subunit
MKYFNYLTSDLEKMLFYVSPTTFDIMSDKRLLSYALGATLYMPATRNNIADDIIAGAQNGLITTVICLEDAIGDNELDLAENNLINQLSRLFNAVNDGKIALQDVPFIFIRVRNSKQMVDLFEGLKDARALLAGFVFPKFSAENGWDYFQQLSILNSYSRTPLFGMPILETSEIIYRETRFSALNRIKQVLDQFYDLVLNVRIGATDFSSLFGIRRASDITIYDIAVIKDCIADIVNVFLRADKEYVISGPVWEYFSRTERVLKPQLRIGPFEEEFGRSGYEKRNRIIDQYIDGLISEVILDRANGLTGKTVIHPTHIKPVQALNVISHEEYLDACCIINQNNGALGVIKSDYGNKMNEIKPHQYWAEKIIIKSKVYGVFNNGHNYTSLL